MDHDDSDTPDSRLTVPAGPPCAYGDAEILVRLHRAPLPAGPIRLVPIDEPAQTGDPEP